MPNSNIWPESTGFTWFVSRGIPRSCESTLAAGAEFASVHVELLSSKVALGGGCGSFCRRWEPECQVLFQPWPAAAH